MVIEFDHWQRKLRRYLVILLDESFEDFLFSDLRSERCQLRSSLIRGIYEYYRSVYGAVRSCLAACGVVELTVSVE